MQLTWKLQSPVPAGVFLALGVSSPFPREGPLTEEEASFVVLILKWVCVLQMRKFAFCHAENHCFDF